MREGKKRDSETAWFDTLEKAEKEAKKQKEIKEKEDRNNITQRRDKKLVTAYEEFIAHLKNYQMKKQAILIKRNIKQQTQSIIIICRQLLKKQE